MLAAPNPHPAHRWPGFTLAAALGAALTLGLFAGLRPAYARPLADPLPVTSLVDSGPGTLREALQNAVDGDTITFSLAPNSVIVVTSELTVTAAITIDGSAATNLIVSGGGVTRVFSATAPLRLVSLSVTGGQVYGSGGGLYSTSAVTLTDVVFVGNVVTDGRGGGLYTQSILSATASSFLTNTTTAITITPGVSRGGGGIRSRS